MYIRKGNYFKKEENDFREFIKKEIEIYLEYPTEENIFIAECLKKLILDSYELEIYKLEHKDESITRRLRLTYKYKQYKCDEKIIDKYIKKVVKV